MKTLSIFAIVFCISLNMIFASYWDEKGNKKMGMPRPGEKYREKPDGPLLEAKGKEPEKNKSKDEYVPVGARYRVFEDQKIDIHEAEKWLKDWKYVTIPNVYQYLDPSEHKPFQAQRIKVFEASKTWKNYLIQGEVLQIGKPGLLIRLKDSEGKIVFLKNHPDQDKLVDGDKLELFAFPTGNYQYRVTDGHMATVKAYDYGTPSDQ